MAAANEGAHREWMFLNKRVGSKCLTSLLGIGHSRLHNASHGHADLRFKAFGFVPSPSLEPSWSWICYLIFTLKFATFTREYFRPNRFAEVRRSKAVKRMKVDAYLMKLYQNAAGMLPTKPLVCIPLSNGIHNTFDCLYPTLNPRFQRGGQKASGARDDLQIVRGPSHEEVICCLVFT